MEVGEHITSQCVFKFYRIVSTCLSEITQIEKERHGHEGKGEKKGKGRGEGRTKRMPVMSEWREERFVIITIIYNYKVFVNKPIKENTWELVT